MNKNLSRNSHNLMNSTTYGAKLRLNQQLQQIVPKHMILQSFSTEMLSTESLKVSRANFHPKESTSTYYAMKNRLLKNSKATSSSKLDGSGDLTTSILEQKPTSL